MTENGELFPDDDDEQPDATRPTVDAADPSRQRDQRRQADLEREQAKLFWTRVLNDPVGQREIWRLLVAAHTFEERFATGPNGFPQPEATWFYAGEQSFGLRFYHMLCRQDRAAVLAMHDLFDSKFAVPAPARRRRRTL